MRFHVVGLAHTRVAEGEFESCAFTQKVRKFGKMMAKRGHQVTIYAPAGSAVLGCEVVECLSEAQRSEIISAAGHYTRASWEGPAQQVFVQRVIAALRSRLAPRDFICLIGGTAHRAIADAFELSASKVVEFGIGYGGSFAKWRVFESSAWMHLTYGAEGGRNPNAAVASEGDEVIPNYFESATLPLNIPDNDPPYLAFMGRLNPDKGLYVASGVAKALGMDFRYAGPENGFERPEWGHYAGELSGSDKASFLGRASVVLCPSQYIEPFCGVAVEAMMCGTPVVTSDFGAFRETVANGRSGIRARGFDEFVSGTKFALDLPRGPVWQWAMQFDCDAVAPRYEHYFHRIGAL